MRAASIAVVVLIGSFFAVGCTQNTSPTSPTSALSIAASGTPAVAAAPSQVPFKGSFDGSDTVMPTTITTAATGNGTHVGRFSLENVTTLATLAGTGHWTAANGDTISTTFVASPLFGPDFLTVTETHTITGGTGRFAGAQGSFTVKRTHIYEPSADGTHVTFGSFEGTITSPGAAH